MKDKKLNNDVLFEAMNEINDQWIEQAADYEVSSKLISFPYYKYVNAVAALLICIIFTVVFYKLQPVNNLTENPDVPLNDNTNEEDISGDDPVSSESLLYSETPVLSAESTESNNIETTDAPENTSVLYNPSKTETPDVPKVTYKPGFDNYGEDDVPANDLTPGDRFDDEYEVPLFTFRPELSPVPDNRIEPVESNLPLLPTEDVITAAPTEDLITAAPTEDVITPKPSSTPVVGNSPSPSPSAIPLPSDTGLKTPRPLPTTNPSMSPFPTPSSEPDKPHSPYDDYYINGTYVDIINLNGAVYDEESRIIEFTEESSLNNTGVQIKNPISGKLTYSENYGYIGNSDKGSKVNVFRLAGSFLGWNKKIQKIPVPDEQLAINPGRTTDIRVADISDTDSVYYPKPDNYKGFSISFWVKMPNDNSKSALVVFADSQQTSVASVSADIDYIDSMNSKNVFSANNNYSCDTQWHFYTITYANDWITLYIDGKECIYDNVELSVKKIGQFNDGFLTRYNASVTWSELDYLLDDKGYIKNQRDVNALYPTITDENYTVFGNGRYKGQNKSGRLMLDFMSGESTILYLGGAKTEAASGSAKYSLMPGTKIAHAKYYLTELNYNQVYAVYLSACESMPE